MKRASASLSLALLLSASSLAAAGEAAGRYGPAEISDKYVEFMGWTADDSTYVYSKRVAIRDYDEQFFHIGPGNGPRIQLLTKPGLDATRLAQVDAELGKIGYAPIGVGTAPKQAANLPPSIQARSGLDAQAQRSAQLIPGSVVSKLNPKSAYDIVINLGAAPAALTPPVPPAAPARTGAPTPAHP